MTAGMRRAQHHCSVRASAIGLSVVPVMESVSATASRGETADDRRNSGILPTAVTVQLGSALSKNIVEAPRAKIRRA